MHETVSVPTAGKDRISFLIEPGGLSWVCFLLDKVHQQQQNFLHASKPKLMGEVVAKEEVVLYHFSVSFVTEKNAACCLVGRTSTLKIKQKISALEHVATWMEKLYCLDDDGVAGDVVFQRVCVSFRHQLTLL